MDHLTQDWPPADYSALFEGIDAADNLHDGIRAIIAARLAGLLEVQPELQGGFPAPHYDPKDRQPFLDYVAAEALGVSVLYVNRAKRLLKVGTAIEIGLVISGDAALYAMWQTLKGRTVPEEKPIAVKPKRSKSRRGRVKRPRPVLVVDNAPPPRRNLTPQEVDPEFTGTAHEFVDKYGHVQVETAEARARRRFGEWSRNMRSLVKAGLKLDWPNVDENWLRSPNAGDIARMETALEALMPYIRSAQSLLTIAQVAHSENAAKKGEANDT